MASLDDRPVSSRAILVALPLILLPLGGVALLHWTQPDIVTASFLLIALTVICAWYLLGGAYFLTGQSQQRATRKVLRQWRPQVDALREPAWICGEDGLILYQNLAALDRFGEAKGQPVAVCLSLVSADAEGEVRRCLDRVGWAGVTELPLSSGDVISARMHEAASVQLWRYLASTTPGRAIEGSTQPDCPQFELLPVALLNLGADGEIRRANLAARNILPGLRDFMPAEGLLLGTLLDGPGRPIRDWLNDVLAARSEMRPEMLRLRGDGTRVSDVTGDRYFQVSLSADPSDPTSLIAVLNDASAVRTLETQFVQSQKMQAIGQLAGGVAHDFNNLLTAIRGCCDLLMMRRDQSDPDFADLDQISQNTNRAAALVSQLLAFSRKQTLSFELLDVRDALSDLAHLLNRLVGERIDLSIENRPNLSAIRADKRQLEQVIMNLVVNARDAMPQGGRILVGARDVMLAAPLTRERVSMPSGRYVCIEVTDSGCGIAEDLRDKIFEPFFTTKRMGEGTGLGLSMVYGIIKQSGGYIFCDSTPGKGSCFSLYFPAHDRAEIVRTDPRARTLPIAASDRKTNVLLVEDEQTVRSCTARALKLKGYDVCEVDSAEAALELLSNRSFAVDVFISDVVMPGMDGPSWVRTALRDRPQTRVIFMSGYSCDIFGDGYAPIPDAVFIAKPFSLREMTELVDEMLRGRSAGQDPAKARQEPVEDLA